MDATQEQWRPVVGHEEQYEVSDSGNVRSVDRIITFPDGRCRTARGRVLKPGRIRTVHQYVNLGKGNSRYVHQLVAEAFIGPCPDGLEICHNNGDPADNRSVNLRYDTHGANVFDTVAHGNHPQARKTHCKNGHEFNDQNTKYTQRQRVCLICKRASRERKAA